MDLAEARAIKAAAVLSFGGDFGMLLNRGANVWADRPAEATQPRLAVGIAGTQSHGYRLQARLQDRSGHTVAALQRLQEYSRGEVDILEIGPVVALGTVEQSRHRPLERGISIGPQSGTGTLGAFVRDGSAAGALLLLSNNHVLANADRQPPGTAILQPGPADGGAPADEVARLLRSVPLDPRRPNRVDAAVATIGAAIPIDTKRPRPLRGSIEQTVAPVEKRGRTTGATTGKVTAFELDNVTVRYPDGRDYRFDGQLEITGHDGPFSRAGDSGSLVTASEDAVGLLFAGTDRGGPGGHGQSYANPINLVLEMLAVHLEL